MHTPGWQSLA